jgi:hypothetical protein
LKSIFFVRLFVTLQNEGLLDSKLGEISSESSSGEESDDKEKEELGQEKEKEKEKEQIVVQDAILSGFIERKRSGIYLFIFIYLFFYLIFFFLGAKQLDHL